MQTAVFAGIDIGSYEVGMKVFEITPKYGIRELTYVRHRIDLGRDSYNTGEISTQSVEELCEVLRDYKRIMKEFRVVAFRACVTSAIRESDNALIIRDRIKVQTGIAIEPLSNSEQRFLGYKSIATQGSAFEEMIQKGTAIFDVGGGSIQISLFDKDKLVTTQNIRMGLVRIRERLAGLEDRPAHIIPLVNELLNPEIVNFKKMYLKDREIRSVILIGDYINYIVMKYNKDQKRIVSRDWLMKIFDELEKKTPAQCARELGIPSALESMILPAIITYRNLINMTGAESIWIPGLTLSDGLAFDYAQSHKLIISNHNFDNDIVAAAKNLAKRYQGNRPHITAMENAALSIFDVMKKISGLNERDRLLLDIAIWLHDCGKFITISQAADSSYSIIMATEIIGLSHRERNLIANIVRFITTEFPDFDELAAMEDIEEDSYLKIAKLAAIARVANATDRSHMQKMKDLKAQLKGNELILSTETMDDITLEKGLMPDKAEFFEDVFGVTPVFRQKRKL